MLATPGLKRLTMLLAGLWLAWPGALAAPVAAEDLAVLKQSYRRPTTIPFPASNPYSLAKATLGKMLYFDPRLSAGQHLNCASCHNPSFGWEVPVARAIGAENTPLGRHAPSVLNHAWSELLFWDGRAATLEEQATGPIQAAGEMNMPLPDLIQRLGKVEGYRRLFARAFPGQGLTGDTLAQAIATYERTVVSTYAPFDAWVDGDEQAISEPAKRGFQLFNGKGRCAACHAGWNFTDNQFHDIGLPGDDPGRWQIDASDERNRQAFKTPTLRDIGQRAPYMHDGSLATLEEVLQHYVAGGIQRPSLSSEMRQVALNDHERQDLLAFLGTLTGAVAVVPLPVLPN